MIISRELLSKYNKPVPRYTSYPPANFFDQQIDQAYIKELIGESNEMDPQNISLYFHVPFCRKLCFYCGCNSCGMKEESAVIEYFQAMFKEVERVFSLLNLKDRKISQIHWGGGTPNAVNADLIDEMMHIIRQNASFTESPEIAMECNPAYLSQDYVGVLKEAGFNRISLGIQDFREDVLNAVNREVPEKPVSEIVEMIRKTGIKNINLDFIYGLPLQTAQSFSETISKAIELQPDRLVTFSYAHLPEFKPAQKMLEKHGLPSADEKMAMFEEAMSAMLSNGYAQIGMDHYAHPKDDLATALAAKELHRNFQGYCTRKTTGQVYAFGVTAISQLGNAYLQNAKETEDYIRGINEGYFPVVKGYIPDPDEMVIRDAINQIMCNNYLSMNEISENWDMDRSELEEILKYDENNLGEFSNDGLLIQNGDGFEVTSAGRFFVRNIAAAIDPLMKDNDKTFSKAV